MYPLTTVPCKRRESTSTEIKNKINTMGREFDKMINE